MATAQEALPDGPILTADGTPLKVSLQKSLVRSKMRAIMLVAPPLLFLLILFILPIGNMLTRSVDDALVNKVFPTTLEAFEAWDKTSEPPEVLYESFVNDVKAAEKLDVGKVGTRMNYAKPGWKSLVKRTARKLKKIKEPPYKDALIKIDKRWADKEFWLSLGIMKDERTMVYFLNSIDKTFDFDKNVIEVDENRKVYNLLWRRTLMVSFIVTIACLLLAYPVSYLLATLPMRISNLLMICVLMPFWTSLLVRIVAWMIMLQQNGVVNDSLVTLGILNEENRLAMMYNFNGTIIVMTQILLPFMILPLYSVMKTIPPSYMKAAQNLGATPTLAFIRIYMPQTIPGIGAGCILVFIVAIGYYITPELVGGKDGRLIGNMVAYHMQSSLNWGLAAAMGTILLITILILYWIYDMVIGIDNMKMG
ncbi:MAG: ABC transporter permease [Gammaproteobacteria bacterium]|nr:ABC transporter permease [Gammaproteobacteria bacterium]